LNLFYDRVRAILFCNQECLIWNRSPSLVNICEIQIFIIEQNSHTASTTGTVTVEAWLGSGNFAYDRENQHVYQIVSATSTWSQAEALAASSTFDGVQGYLATITTQDEDNFVVARIFQDGWIGATDDPTEGQWHWATGPEAGLQFWSGSATGTPVAGQFSNWFMGEPNNQYSISNPSDTMSSSSPYGENCAEIRIVEDNGQWNDEACNSPLPNYVVEYGAPGNLPNVAASSFTVTVNLPASVVGLQTIQSYASSMGTTTAPTVQNYTDAGVTGVNSSNLAAMNLALAGGGTIANLAAAQQLVTQELPIIASANAAAAAAAAAAANTQVQSFHGVGGQMAFPTISTGQVQSNESVTAPSISNVSTSVQVPQVPSIVSAASASTPVPTRDLQLGMNGNDVVMLQQFLNGNGYTIAASGAGSSGNETIYFGSLTKSALAKWQKAHGVSPASGYFGSITRAKMKSLGVSGLWW
jgi:hypothetical protein